MEPEAAPKEYFSLDALEEAYSILQLNVWVSIQLCRYVYLIMSHIY